MTNIFPILIKINPQAGKGARNNVKTPIYKSCFKSSLFNMIRVDNHAGRAWLKTQKSWVVLLLYCQWFAHHSIWLNILSLEFHQLIISLIKWNSPFNISFINKPHISNPLKSIKQINAM